MLGCNFDVHTYLPDRDTSIIVSTVNGYLDFESVVGDDKAEQDDGGHGNKCLQRRRVEGSLQQQQTELRLTAQKNMCAKVPLLPWSHTHKRKYCCSLRSLSPSAIIIHLISKEI